MRLLLDTHVALWAILDAPELGQHARELIEDRANDIFVSAASLWEIAIKFGLNRRGKSAMRLSAADASKYFEKAGYQFLPVTRDHACAVEQLPGLHSDPFDRILIAQALSEPMRFLTRDDKLAEYGSIVIAV